MPKQNKVVLFLSLVLSVRSESTAKREDDEENEDEED